MFRRPSGLITFFFNCLNFKMMRSIPFPCKHYLLFLLMVTILPTRYALMAQTNVIVAVNSESRCQFPFSNAQNPETAVDIFKNDCEVIKVFTSSKEIFMEYDDCGTIYPLTPLQFYDFSSNRISVTNPDVALIYPHNDSVYAIVVYYSPGESGYIYESYVIEKTNPTVLILNDRQLLATVATPPGINDNGIRVDANMNGDFVIVWDDIANKQISLIPGYIYAGEPVLDCPGTQPCTGYAPILLPYSEVTAPDVALSNNGIPNYGSVFISFLNYDRNKVIVDYQMLEDLWYTGFSPVPNVINPNNIYNKDYSGSLFGRPRIAAPGNGPEEDWSVVHRVDFSGDHHICGNTRNASVDYLHNYTDNSEPLLIEEGIMVSANDWHEYPAISYGENDEGNAVAQIVWYGGWSEPLTNGTDGKTIVSVSIDDFGFMNSCTPGGKGFKMVPHLNVSDPYEAYHPSIAGRHLKGNPKMSVAWWDNTNQDVYTKDFTWCDASFRKPITKQVNTDIQIIDALKNILYPPDLSELVRQIQF